MIMPNIVHLRKVPLSEGAVEYALGEHNKANPELWVSADLELAAKRILTGALKDRVALVVSAALPENWWKVIFP